jgi:hypothetical protein
MGRPKKYMTEKERNEAKCRNRKKWRDNNPLYDLSRDKEKTKERLKNWYDKNKQNQKKYREINSEKIKATKKQYRLNNKDYLQETSKTRYYLNRDLILKKQSEYKKTHLQERQTYERKRIETDISYKIRKRLSTRISMAVRENNSKKYKSTIILLGFSIYDFRNYLESKFIEGMTWDNYGLKGWHIDHIRPCASFDLTDPEQQKQCFHYTNLQPLWAEDNLRKSDKWEA